MTGKHLRLNVHDDGYDIYAPREVQTWGYRYGPSIMQYGDGRLDAWFASPGAAGEADWFTYKHSDDDGATWSDEVVVLTPTADSLDLFSVCDPAVIRFGGYYYIGYTSTIFADSGGVCNHAFVARSKNPDGPFVKWTGSGWGEQRGSIEWMGKPSPIVYYDEPWQFWGAGELSFVKVDDTLYIYYSWTSKDRDNKRCSQTRVATADATRDDWPLTIKQQGVAIERVSTGHDSADMLYIDEYGKFAAVVTDKRFTPESVIGVYESDDGLRYTRVNELRTHIGFKCHNCGISADPERHISCNDDVVLGYAYGDKWAYWGTRFHKAHFTLTDEPDFSDAVRDNVARPVEPWKMPDKMWPVAVTTIPHYYEAHVSDAPFDIQAVWLDTCYEATPLTESDEVHFTDYDTDIVEFRGLKCVPKSVGYTYCVLKYMGRSVEFLIYVRADSEKIADPNRQVVSMKPSIDTYTLVVGKNERKQIRVMATYSDNSWFEIYSASSGVRYDDYDSAIINVNAEGEVIERGVKGETTVRVECGELYCIVTVRVV